MPLVRCCDADAPPGKSGSCVPFWTKLDDKSPPQALEIFTNRSGSAHRRIGATVAGTREAGGLKHIARAGTPVSPTREDDPRSRLPFPRPQRIPGIPHPLERCRSRHPHPEAGQGGVCEAAVSQWAHRTNYTQRVACRRTNAIRKTISLNATLHGVEMGALQQVSVRCKKLRRKVACWSSTRKYGSAATHDHCNQAVLGCTIGCTNRCRIADLHPN